MPPAIVPQITMIIMLFPEKTEPECLDHDMLIYSKSVTMCRISHLRKYQTITQNTTCHILS